MIFTLEYLLTVLNLLESYGARDIIAERLHFLLHKLKERGLSLYLPLHARKLFLELLNIMACILDCGNFQNSPFLVEL